ncbi:MAG: hypothetical protein IKC59_03520 [Clostridia bacterium]|nr:hypothetical protein [Clostridia bacterium]
MTEFYTGPMTTCGQAYIKMYELCLLKTYGSVDKETGELIPGYTPDEDITADDITAFCKEAPAKLAEMGFSMDKNGGEFSGLQTFIKDWTTLTSWLAPTDSTTANQPYLASETANALSPAKAQEGGMTILNNRAMNGQEVTWLVVYPYIDGMVTIGTATMNGIPVSGITSNNVLSLLGASSYVATVKGGMIYNMDARVRGQTLNGGILVENLTVSFMGYKLKNVTVNTSAPVDYPRATQTLDLKSVYDKVGAKTLKTQFTALDTYGYAIDFWVRTNAEDSYLILEGKVETEDEPKKIQLGEDFYDLYTVTITTTVQEPDANGTFQTVGTPTEETGEQAYKKDGVWYYAVDSLKIERTDDLMNENGEVTSRVIKTVTSEQAITEKVVTGYSGVNRVWSSSTDKMDRFSTSQGSGSCYVFYPDDPNSFDQSLEILSALRIAFIDSNAELLAIASLDTKHYFAEYGKVTVPLVLNSDAIDTGIKDADGDIVRGITYLEQNKATFICALVYLDGAVIGNEQVLATQEITGNFNIQFGSTAALDPIANDALQQETRQVSAKLSAGSSINVDTIAFEGTEGENRDVTVTVRIDGAPASTVTANFTRQINENQGARQESLTFTSADGGKTWTATATFDHSGTYLLREIAVDGDSCTLESPCKVTVAGFTVNSIWLQYGENHAFRTAASAVTENVSVTMSSGPDGDLPESVKAVFSDGVVTIVTELKPGANDEVWEGQIQFASSGTYTMNYLILENDLGNAIIDTRYQDIGATYTRNVFLGLRATVEIQTMDEYLETEYMKGHSSVYTSSGIEFFIESPHKYNVSLVITDETGNPVPNLDDVSLYYTNSLDAKLVWSAAQQKYVGSLTETKENPVEEFIVSGEGVYEFSKVVINGEEVTIASYAPIIRAYSNASMDLDHVYLAESDYVVALSEGDPTETISFGFRHAATATVYGLFEKTGGAKTEYYVIPAARGNTALTQNEYTFTIPRENGYWELKEVKMSGVIYDPNLEDNVDGTSYDGTALQALLANEDGSTKGKASIGENTAAWDNVSGYFDLTETFPYWNADSDEDEVEVDGTITKVKVVATVATQTLTYLDENGTAMTGNPVVLKNAFMEQVSLPTMKITIQDFENQAIEGVGNVIIYMEHDSSTAAYDGPANGDFEKEIATGQDYSWSESTGTKLTDNGDGTYSVTPTEKIWFDGKYDVKFTYKIGTYGDTVVVTSIDLQSTIPTVVLSATDPSVTTEFKAYNTSNKEETVKNAIGVDTDNKPVANIYTQTYTTGIRGRIRCYYSSNLTISLSNSGYAESISLPFYSGTSLTQLLYEGVETGGAQDSTQSPTSKYQWDNSNAVKNGCDGTCMRYVGKFSEGYALFISEQGTKTPAGTIKATGLVATYDGVSYTIPVTVTINNPY